MNNFQKIINNKIIERYEQVLIIDIIEDKIYEYINNNNNFELKKEASYIEYFNNFKNYIYEDDIQNYIDSLSINKLESFTLNYRMIDNKIGTYMNYVNNISLYDNNGKKMIVVLISKADSVNNKVPENSNTVALESKVSKLIDAVSMAMLKIHNVTNMDNNIRTKDEYINSILTELTKDYPELNKSLNENASEVYAGSKQTILIIDDDRMTCNLIGKVFDKNYNIMVANNGKEAINTLISAKSNFINISCIFLDLIMPEMDGFGVLDFLNDNNYLMRLPVVIISGNYDKETRNRAYSYQIADMLEKPFNAQVIRHRIENLIGLYHSSGILSSLLLEQQQDSRRIIESLVKSYEIDNASDMAIVKEYVKILTTQISIQYPEYNINNNIIKKISDSSAYYNIGKYTLPKYILNKNTEYTLIEKDIIKSENVNGASIVKIALSNDNSKVDPQYCYEIVKYYHERYDGLGYPEKLSGNNIPLSACIVSLVVEYIRLVKITNPIDYEKIAYSIIMESGHKFNPKVVEAFKNVKNKFEMITKVGE